MLRPEGNTQLNFNQGKRDFATCLLYKVFFALLYFPAIVYLSTFQSIWFLSFFCNTAFQMPLYVFHHVCPLSAFHNNKFYLYNGTGQLYIIGIPLPRSNCICFDVRMRANALFDMQIKFSYLPHIGHLWLQFDVDR